MVACLIEPLPVKLRGMRDEKDRGNIGVNLQAFLYSYV